MPLVLGILIMVVSSVPVRTILFPSAPRALVNIRTGGIQKPQVGLLGTNDTLTGAPEKQPHEAIEEEAANLVENVRHNIQRAVGMHISNNRMDMEIHWKERYRIRIVAVLAPLFLLPLFVSYYMVYKGIYCLVGFVVFGDPMLTPTIAWLKGNVPKYEELAQPKKSVFQVLVRSNADYK